jgi:hypothetical protein
MRNALHISQQLAAAAPSTKQTEYRAEYTKLNAEAQARLTVSTFLTGLTFATYLLLQPIIRPPQQDFTALLRPTVAHPVPVPTEQHSFVVTNVITAYATVEATLGTVARTGNVKLFDPIVTLPFMVDICLGGATIAFLLTAIFTYWTLMRMAPLPVADKADAVITEFDLFRLKRARLTYRSVHRFIILGLGLVALALMLISIEIDSWVGAIVDLILLGASAYTLFRLRSRSKDLEVITLRELGLSPAANARGVALAGDTGSGESKPPTPTAI